jgi:hypothetical protein
MPAADDYQQCAAISARLAETLPPEPRAHWLAMSERWTALATSARVARMPHAPVAADAAVDAQVDDTDRRHL